MRRIVGVIVAALLMGLPFVRGGFVGGDDHRLLLNHVLVNHPSLAHAFQLFGIVHRDLYQPIPLLTFSIEFAVASALGLFARGVHGGAWLFHLDNVLLHAINSVLVFWVIDRLHRAWTEGLHLQRGTVLSNLDTPAGQGDRTATVVAILFAVHPLQVEVVAWLNGRMMLLSTMFALASMLTLARWLTQPRIRWAVGTLLLVTLCMMCKVRVGVPALLVIVAVALRHRVRLGSLALWSLSVAVTAVFVVINLKTTADSEFFSLAGEHMTGPRLVRILRSMAWYLSHFVWPTGLASWYPAPPSVSWSDPETFRSLIVVAAGSLLVGWSCWKSIPALLGAGWFLCTLVDTLPIVPARNVLAADRYMYLSIIGLLWIVGIKVEGIFQRVFTMNAGRPSRVLAIAVPGAILVALLGNCWFTGSFYSRAITKTERIAQLFPETPHVWARLGWAYHKLGNAALSEGSIEEARTSYIQALECAERELKNKNPKGWSEAYQVMGVTKLKLGEAAEAIGFLERAINLDSSIAEPRYWLAWAYDELGTIEKAIPLYESAFAEAPGHNPTILRLAKLYRERGRPDDARQMYAKALSNNEFEAPAILGLAELDIETGTRESYFAAQQRLSALLDWMPENIAARINLAIVYQRLGRTAEAIARYEEILQSDSLNVTAAVNLAQILHSMGERDRAKALFDRAASAGPVTLEETVAIADFYIDFRAGDRAVQLFEGFQSRFPNSEQAVSHAAWYYTQTGNASRAATLLQAYAGDFNDPQILITRIYLALLEADYPSLAQWTEAVARTGAAGVSARQRLLSSLERFDELRPNEAWTFALAARLLLASGQTESARVFKGLAERNCSDPACRDYISSLIVP